jgi:hypothetical protein
MKLYTEEQVRKAISLATCTDLDYEYILDSLNPIELPSDEYIEISAPIINKISAPIINRNGFIHGAKWMRDKLTKTKEK